MIRNVSLSDAPRIAEIYNYYINNTIITFEETEIDAGEIERRIQHVREKHFPYIVYEEDGRLLAYAYIDNWRSRSAYDISLETSIYLDIHATGKGIGPVLYRELITKSKEINIHSLIGVISLPNEASRKLHERLGFRLVGNFRESGLKFNRLIDVEFWQLILS
ncbi:MAG: GNAT family N-acetyltransferase [Dysgonamonadaceae bacterium]|jgi:phosphinothricin acetyltransferase|nr:GNAT family N-acetyltransferase [Dysgonamonadaceae bacterium]